MPFLPDSQMEMPEIAEGRKPVNEAELNTEHPLAHGITDMLSVYSNIRTIVPSRQPATYVRADWETKHHNKHGHFIVPDETSVIRYPVLTASDMTTSWSAFIIQGGISNFDSTTIGWGRFANIRTLGVRPTSNQIRVHHRGGLHTISTPITIVSNVLYKAGVTYDSESNEVRVYLDGKRIGTETATGTDTGQDSRLEVSNRSLLAFMIHWRLRPLTDEDHLALALNPYQMLVPK